MTQQYLEQRVVEEAIELARLVQRIGRFSQTVEPIDGNDYLVKKMGDVPLVGALVYMRNKVLSIRCGIVGYEEERPQLAGVWIQNIDPEARLDDQNLRNRQYQNIGAVIYEIPSLTIDMTIEEVRKFHNVETGFLYARGRGQNHLTAPVFEKVLLCPRTKDEIADAIMDVDRAGQEWERALGGLDSEMAGAYRQAVAMHNRR